MKANELTSKDLMIGDWLMFEGTPFKIGCILEYNTVRLCDWIDIVGIEYAQPVEITKELLEKNGFELKSESPYSQCFAIDFHDVDIDYLVVELHPKANYVRVNYQTEKRKVQLSCSLGGCHLHELQHLLKLCNIDIDWKV